MPDTDQSTGHWAFSEAIGRTWHVIVWWLRVVMNSVLKILDKVQYTLSALQLREILKARTTSCNGTVGLGVGILSLALQIKREALRKLKMRGTWIEAVLANIAQY